MDISLSPDNEKFLQSQIAAGIYNSINEAINATISIAISQIEIAPDEIASLRKDIAKGMDDIMNYLKQHENKCQNEITKRIGVSYGI